MRYTFDEFINSIRYNEAAVTKIDLLDHFNDKYIDNLQLIAITDALEYNDTVTEIIVGCHPSIKYEHDLFHTFTLEIARLSQRLLRKNRSLTLSFTVEFIQDPYFSIIATLIENKELELNELTLYGEILDFSRPEFNSFLKLLNIKKAIVTLALRHSYQCRPLSSHILADTESDHDIPNFDDFEVEDDSNDENANIYDEVLVKAIINSPITKIVIDTNSHYLCLAPTIIAHKKNLSAIDLYSTKELPGYSLTADITARTIKDIISALVASQSSHQNSIKRLIIRLPNSSTPDETDARTISKNINQFLTSAKCQVDEIEINLGECGSILEKGLTMITNLKSLTWSTTAELIIIADIFSYRVLNTRNAVTLNYLNLSTTTPYQMSFRYRDIAVSILKRIATLKSLTHLNMSGFFHKSEYKLAFSLEMMAEFRKIIALPCIKYFNFNRNHLSAAQSRDFLNMLSTNQGLESLSFSINIIPDEETQEHHEDEVILAVCKLLLNHPTLINLTLGKSIYKIILKTPERKMQFMNALQTNLNIIHLDYYPITNIIFEADPNYQFHLQCKAILMRNSILTGQGNGWLRQKKLYPLLQSKKALDLQHNEDEKPGDLLKLKQLTASAVVTFFRQGKLIIPSKQIPKDVCKLLRQNGLELSYNNSKSEAELNSGVTP